MTTETKITPGPWNVYDNKETGQLDIIDVHYEAIAYSANAKAEARAIAAVPELIAALRLALPAVAMHTPNGARTWPEDTPHTETGEIDLVQIAHTLDPASLIAAAPAMLEALQIVAKALPLIADGLCHPEDIRAVADIAQRAVDSVTGGVTAEALAEVKRRIAAATPSGPGKRRAIADGEAR